MSAMMILVWNMRVSFFHSVHGYKTRVVEVYDGEEKRDCDRKLAWLLPQD